MEVDAHSNEHFWCKAERSKVDLGSPPPLHSNSHFPLRVGEIQFTEKGKYDKQNYRNTHDNIWEIHICGVREAIFQRQVFKTKEFFVTLCLKDKRMNVVKMNFSIHNWEITSTRSNILTIIVCNGLENTVNKSYFLLNEAIRRRNPRLNLTNCCWSPWFLFKHFGVLLLDNFYLLLIHIKNIDFF